MQDTLLRAWYFRHRFDYRDNGDLKNWLVRIMLNLNCNRMRGLKAKVQHVSIEDIDPNTDTSYRGDAYGIVQPSQEHHVEVSQTYREMDDLPPQQREFLKAAVEGLSYSDMETVFARPRGSVCSGLNRARNQLKRRMG